MKQLQYREMGKTEWKVYAEATIVTKEMRHVSAFPAKSLGDYVNWETRIVDTRVEKMIVALASHVAIEAVERAPWDEHDSALTGADIWGAHGTMAQHAASHFTYEQAKAVALALGAP